MYKERMKKAMKTIDITAKLDSISFLPKSEIEEILQNVQTILTTPKYSVPLDRNFGINTTLLDAPIPVAQAKLTADIINAIQVYEPRVTVLKVTYVSDNDAGIIFPKVRLKINEQK